MHHPRTWFFLFFATIGAFFVLSHTGFGAWLQNTLFISSKITEDERAAYIREIAFLKSDRITNRGEETRKISGIAAFVYSFYPHGIKNEVVIDRGALHGVRDRSAVVVDNIFVGFVHEVKDHSSLVTTIFDPQVRVAVRIGESQIDGLLIGGGEPRVTLVPKIAKIKPGDTVFIAAPEFPYGIPVGTVKEFYTSQHEVFGEIELVIPYHLNALRDVRVLPSHL